MKKNVKILLVVVKVCVTLAFALVLYRSVESMQEVMSLITPTMLVWAFICSLIMQAMHIHRWQLALVLEGSRFSYVQCAKSYAVGALLGVISPGRVGEVLRFYFLPELHVKRAFLALLFDRLFLVAGLAMLGSVGLYFLAESTTTTQFSRQIYHVVYLSGAVGSLIYLIAPFVIRGHINASMGKHPYLLFAVESLGVNCMVVIQTGTLLFLTGLVTLQKGLLIASAAFSSMQLIPFSIANIGTREYFLSRYYSVAQGGPESSFIPPEILAISLIILGMNIVLPALPGVLILLLNKREGKTAVGEKN